MSEPLVSILMNCYNSQQYLEETLLSLVNQTYKNWQLVFVDNCSTDNSRIIVDDYRQDPRIVFLQTPYHMPLGEAREYGINYCSGDFICFLDTDDLWVPTKLEKQISLFLQYPELVLCYSGYYFIDENGKVIGKSHLQAKFGNLFGENIARYLVNFQTVMITQESLKKIQKPYFDPLIKYSPDYNLVLRVMACGTSICQKDRLAYYRISNNSLTSKSIHLWGEECEYTYNQLQNNGVLLANSTASQRRICLAYIAYLKARYYISKGDYFIANSLLNKYKFTNYKFLMTYLISKVPLLWKLAHRIKKRVRKI